MKINKLILGLALIGSLSMVGCDDIQDTGSAMEEPTKKVEQSTTKPCDVCGEEFNDYELEEVQGALMCKGCAQWHNDEIAKYDEENKTLALDEATELVDNKFKEYGIEGMEIIELNDGFNDRNEFIYFEATRNPLHREAGIVVKVDVHTKEMFIVADDHAGKKITKPIDDILKDATK